MRLGNVGNNRRLPIRAIICRTIVVRSFLVIIVTTTRPSALGYARTLLIHHSGHVLRYSSKSSIARGRYSEVALQPCMSILNQTCHIAEWDMIKSTAGSSSRRKSLSRYWWAYLPHLLVMASKRALISCPTRERTHGLESILCQGARAYSRGLSKSKMSNRL